MELGGFAVIEGGGVVAEGAILVLGDVMRLVFLDLFDIFE